MKKYISNPLFPNFFGGGGGGGGGSSDYTNTPDNLRSTDTFEGLMGICAGPIKGPVNDLNSINLDDTPIMDESGEPNFPEFAAGYSTGDPTLFPQKPILRLGSAAAPQSVNLQLSNNNSSGPGPWVSRTVTNTGPNYIDIRFIVQSLYHQTEKGIFNGIAHLDIEMKLSGTSTWINPFTGNNDTWLGGTYGQKEVGGGMIGFFTSKIISAVQNTIPNGGSPDNLGRFAIKGKTTSPTIIELRIWTPNTGAYENANWDIRARLLEKDSYVNDQDVDSRQIFWESVAAIYNEELGEEEEWRGVSWLQLYGKATDNLKGVPDVSMVADTKIVSVPNSSVYNPETRTFTGAVWDGSWVKAFTTDPAWIINDAISDPIFGLAAFTPGANLNKWDALEASKWFSTQVPDGNGGTHPRYNLNVVHNQPMKAEDFIQYLAGAVGGFAYDDGSGQWRLKVDKPEVPIDIFTLENIEGEFSYSHTDVDTRYNEYRGTFLNEEFDYREETIAVYDNTSIGLIGHKPTTLALVGCTNRQEALRRLMIRLRSSTLETKVVNFTTNRRADHLVPLETILVADADLGDQDARTTGRLVEISEDRLHVKVRDTLRLEVGVDYKMKFAVINDEYNPDAATDPTSDLWKQPTLVEEIDVANTTGQRGNVTDIYLADPLPDTAEYLTVALEATGLPTIPKLYRILSLSKNDSDDNDERVVVSAVEIDVEKWDAADNVDPQDAIFTDLRKVAPSPLPPTSGDIVTLVSTPGPQSLNHTIIGNWVRPLGANIDGFRVFYTVNGGPKTLLVERTLIPSFDLVNPAHGDYVFYIHTITKTGVLSSPITDTITVDLETLAAADIAYADGQTIESLQPSQAGADPTGSNVAAGILGQGTLATQNAVDFVTQVTGALKPENGATRNVTRGTWTTLTAYAVGDIVTYNGDGYIVHTAHTSTGSFDSSKFYTFAQSGITVDLKFRRTNSTPATPTGDDPADWEDSPPAGIETLWMVRGNRNSNGELIGLWSTPASLTGLVFRGTYSASEAYLINQTVLYNGGTYVAIVNTTGHAPSGTGQANAWWDVIAAPGEQGAPGDPPSAPTSTINLSSSTGAVNLRTIADANGYTGASDATYNFVVPNGVTIRGLADAGSGAGIGIDTGTWPAGYTITLGLTIQSGGIVDGGGGKGGTGGTNNNGGSGTAGGHAIYLRTNMANGVTINSGGTLRGGGGGGGGGGGNYASGPDVSSPGDGGGGGFPNGTGGMGGDNIQIGDAGPDGQQGSNGTTSGGGAGGTTGTGGNGGAGGNAGSAGTTGSTFSTRSGGSGGAAGKAVAKNGFTCTVTNNGTMAGAAS